MHSVIDKGNEIQKQIEILRKYNQALEAQNESKNRQRSILQEEIRRLTNMQSNHHKVSNVVKVCSECTTYKNKISLHQSEVIKYTTNISTLKTQNEQLQKQITQHKQYKQSTTQYRLIQQKYKQLQLKYRNLETQNNKVRLNEKDMKTRTQQNYKIVKEKEQLKNKVTVLQMDLLSLKSSISTKDYEISKLKNSLQESKTKSYNIQHHHHNQEKLSLELLQKQAIIRALQTKEQQQNKQVFRLDSIVSQYMEKINHLSIQLEQIEKESSTTANISVLQHENYTLNERIKDLQRRIQILQETNYNLQQQLKISIQARKSVSTITYSNLSHNMSSSNYANNNNQYSQLKDIIKQLKGQLHQEREFNYEIKAQNQRIQAKLSQLQLNNSHLSQTSPKNYSRNNQSSNLSFKFKNELQKNNNFSFNNSRAHFEPVSFKNINQSLLKPEQQKKKKKGSNISEMQKERYQSLQSKINILKNENAGLKKHLFDKK